MLLHPFVFAMPEASDAERLAIGSFLVGCMVCMGLSVAYHTFGSLSRRAHDVLLRLDYTGITVQILCSFVPCVYYWSPPALQADAQSDASRRACCTRRSQTRRSAWSSR